jgi:hypothetical protein
MKTLRINLMLTTLLFVGLLLSACGSTAADPQTNAQSDDMAAMKEGEDMAAMNSEVPADLDTATSKLSDNELYQVSILSNVDPPVLNEIHDWTLHVQTPAGEPVEGAEVTIDGGMPQHNHGFPTSPQVTQDLGGGDYLVEGVRFNMAGWWEMKFDIQKDGQADTVTFNVVMAN